MKNTLLATTLVMLTACVSNPVIHSVKYQSRDLYDSDNDGVINARDNCEGTDKEAITDNDGCPTEI
ncbi:MAG: hypothetical protein ACTJH9_09770 [Pseudoalteromonas sp.]|uniref:hypothetical protein n=1 Tax=unclassified Pseudoalteromonas TaxID=194690 RepID=UPI003F97BAD7